MSTLGVGQFLSRTSNNFFLKSIFFSSMSALIKTRICNSLGMRMKFKAPFMSGEEKHGHRFDFPLFFKISMQFLAPGV